MLILESAISVLKISIYPKEVDELPVKIIGKFFIVNLVWKKT